MTSDRNFDDIAEHFAHKVYGGLKGKIRLAVLNRDIDDYLASQHQPLNVLDVGAGLAQISLRLATLGHHCTINDISANMLKHAEQQAQMLGVASSIRLQQGAYQSLPVDTMTGHYNLILCHAVLEWLASPRDIMAFFRQCLTDDGVLSLCFYNPASLVYRNLVMGNFYQLNQPKPADNRSLTPNHPVDYETVKAWLAEHHFEIISESGIRTFFDYTVHRRGGLSNDDAIIDMELQYSKQLPYRLMGRYLHILAKKS